MFKYSIAYTISKLTLVYHNLKLFPFRWHGVIAENLQLPVVRGVLLSIVTGVYISSIRHFEPGVEADKKFRTICVLLRPHKVVAIFTCCRFGTHAQWAWPLRFLQTSPGFPRTRDWVDLLSLIFHWRWRPPFHSYLGNMISCEWLTFTPSYPTFLQVDLVM